ncbi:MAG: EAL domain-containing protein [Egibacteraceae bacterium]
MTEPAGVLAYAGAAVFCALAIVGMVQWRRRGTGAVWLTVTFCVLGLVALLGVSSLYPQPSHPAYGPVTRVLAGILVSVPYLQYRFMASFETRRRGEEAVVAVVAAAVVAGALLVPDLGGEGESYPPALAVFVGGVLTYWVAVTGLVAHRLWANGRAQPMVVRLRMRTLAAGSLGLALAVVVSGASPSSGDRTSLAIDGLALLAGLLLLAGFAPPPVLRAWWRRREGARTWQLASSVMEAVSPAEVAAPCVRHASRLFGGRGALLADGDGTVLAAQGLPPDEARRLAAGNAAATDARMVVPCGSGSLIVQPSVFTPFFGDEETDELRGVAALAELALTRVALHDQARTSYRQLAEAQSLAKVGSWQWDTDSERVRWSDELFRLYGLEPQASDMRAADIAELVHPDDRDMLAEAITTACAQRQPFELEYRVVHPDGTIAHLFVRGRTTELPGGALRLVGVCRDVTERRVLEEAVARGALRDPLTELANRMLFTERLSRALARTGEGDSLMAVLLLDLDDFAAINDTWGPAAGDQVLRVVANRLQSLARSVDTVARLGADQFAILLEGTDLLATTTLAERIRVELTQPVAVPGGEVTVQGSMGVTAGVRAVTAGEFLRNADAAMRAAKAAGKGGYQVFEDTMHEQLSRRLALRADLQRAVSEEQLWLAYQPIVSLTDGRVLAVEALVRWDHPILGPVSPTEFIPIAEDSGMIGPIGHWVVEQSLAQLCTWRRQRPALARLELHVNISARELKQVALVERFTAALEASGLDPAALTVEVTESVLMGERDASIAALEALRQLGVRVAVDDFGTGYSSLSYLRRLPVDTLKIDKSFIDGITLGPDDAALARAIIRIGETMHLGVVAEGVETAAQATRLRAMGCLAAQGFHFFRPLPAAELPAAVTAPADVGAAAS